MCPRRYFRDVQVALLGVCTNSFAGGAPGSCRDFCNTPIFVVLDCSLCYSALVPDTGVG